MPIRKVKGGFKIDNVAGVSRTRASAERRQRAIKAQQSERNKARRRRNMRQGVR